MPEPGSPIASPPEALGFERIRYERDAAARRRDRHDRPARGPERPRLPTLREMARAFEQASWDDCVAVVVVTGAGDRAFCTGADLDEQAPWAPRAASTGAGWARSSRCTTACATSASRRSPASTASASAAARSSSWRATSRSSSTTRTSGTSGRSTDRCRPAARPSGCRSSSATGGRARSSCSASRFSRQQALEWGLVSRVVPRAELDATVAELADKLRAEAARGAALHQDPAQLVARPRLVADRRARS